MVNLAATLARVPRIRSLETMRTTKLQENAETSRAAAERDDPSQKWNAIFEIHDREHTFRHAEGLGTACHG